MPESSCTVWYGERAKQLVELFDEGLSASQAGAILGVSRSAVIGAWNRRGLTRGAIVKTKKPKPHKPPKRPKPPKKLVDYGPVSSIQARTRQLEKKVLGEKFSVGTAKRTKPFRRASGERAAPYRRADELPETLTACRWPIGDPKHPDFHFCGAPTNDRVYCPGHMARACSKGTRNG